MNIFQKKIRFAAVNGRRWLALPMAVGLATALTACDDNDVDSESAVETVQVDEFAALTEVDSETFNMEPFLDGYAFDFRTGGPDGTVGLCLASDGKVACLGTPDDDAPDATKSLAGRPNGIELTGGETEYVNYDFTGGVPPEEELQAGQKVIFGTLTCGMVDDETLKCKEDGAWFTIEGDDRDIVVGEDRAAATSSTAASVASGDRVEDVNPEDFAMQRGAHAFLFEDGETVCLIADGSSGLRGLGCYVELDDPPLSPGNNVPVSLFEMTPAGVAGLTTDLHPIDRNGIETLEPGQRITVEGISCTALGGADFSCEANGTEVVFEDGETPDIPVVAGGAGAILNAAGTGSGSPAGNAGNVRTSGSCGAVASSARPEIAGAVVVRQGTVDCGEIMPIIESYIETTSDGTYGMENWRFYGDWTCKNPRELRGAEPMFLVSCSTDAGYQVVISNPEWRP